MPRGLSDRTLSLLEHVSPAERHAILVMYNALENDETLVDWCRRHGEPYSPIQRRFARARVRLQSLEKA